MNHLKVQFSNKEGLELTGIIDLPLNQSPHNFVLFAHCFTCNKNFKAPRDIARALTSRGYGVLRFDFTGLGRSEGDFADSNFSGNVEDLVAAARYLEQNHQAPTIIIGHSLGGAAALFAAHRLESVEAVATIASPSKVEHVSHLLKSGMEEIRKEGKAVINIGGRDFTIKEQFLEDLTKNRLSEVLGDLRKPLLILHSPLDKIVSINHAEELYIQARHPKSFITLDTADHLLSADEDSLYAGQVIGAWATRYVSIPAPDELETEHQVVANLGEEGYTTQIKSGNHYFVVDEPVAVGGSNFGPTPYELISAALAACTSITIQMYARRKKWQLENVETHVSYSRSHARDCSECDLDTAKIDTFKRYISIKGMLEEKQRKRILQIADRCPVHRTLSSQASIRTESSFN